MTKELMSLTLDELTDIIGSMWVENSWGNGALGASPFTKAPVAVGRKGFNYSTFASSPAGAGPVTPLIGSIAALTTKQKFYLAYVDMYISNGAGAPTIGDLMKINLYTGNSVNPEYAGSTLTELYRRFYYVTSATVNGTYVNQIWPHPVIFQTITFQTVVTNLNAMSINLSINGIEIDWI